MALNFDRLKNLLLLAFFFNVVSFSLGYHTVNSFIPEIVPEAADAYIYKDLVQNGTSAVTTDHRSSRILIPAIARGIYLLLPSKVGTWDSASLGLLVVNSVISSLIALLIIHITARLGGSSFDGLLAALLFYVNFATPNYYLANLVDSGECLFSLLLFLSLYNNKWFFLPLIAFFGVLIKETFLPVSILFVSSWFALEFLETKKINLRKGLWLVSFVLVSFVVVIALKSFAFGKLMFPWNYAGTLLKPQLAFASPKAMSEIRRFLYVFIWLLPFSVFYLKRIPKLWLVSSVASVSVIMALSIWAGTSGAATSRYLFNYIGPLLCVSSCWFMKDLVNSIIPSQKL